MSTIPIDPSHISDDRLGDRGADDTRVFTIGHSNHSLERSLALLAKHRITAVADVRPEPYSRFRPHFSRDALAAGLKAHGIDYAFLGREFGGRPADSDCYRDGRVDYERVARTSGFRDGVAWVIDRAARDRIALICAEKEPLDCHRTLLVARALDEAGVAVVHILADGALEPHGRTMDRLMAAFDRPAPDLHRNPVDSGRHSISQSKAMQRRNDVITEAQHDTGLPLPVPTPTISAGGGYLLVRCLPL